MVRIRMFILGFGQVGQTLARLILDTHDSLTQRVGLQIFIVGVADSTSMLLEDEGLTTQTVNAALDAKATSKKLSSLPGSRSLPFLSDAPPREAIVVDTTASTETRSVLLEALEAGGGVVLANKHPVSGPLDQARVFFNHPRVKMEATVGAGLPVVNTLNTLLATGDRVLSLEGCLSGTLGFLCSELEDGVPYSRAVSNARDRGYTEPDPREDLSGRDVARKAVIMGRLAGWQLEIADLAIETLYSGALADLSVSEFFESCDSLNETYAERILDAQSRGRVLRYVARVKPNGGTVGLEAVDKRSQLGALGGPSNSVAIQTTRYDKTPLAISGPGAGLAVTAAGILGDIVDLARQRSIQA